MSLDYRESTGYVEEHIGAFHAARLRSLEAITLPTILRRKNPYLFRAKNIRTAEALVKTLFDAYLSSQEETIFGDFLEGLAIFIAGRVYDGHKSAAVGVDLELVGDNTHYLVAIKSGPNWGNSSQIARMRDNFATAKRVLNTNRQAVNVVAVNGCCYGRDNRPDKGDYLKYCGQRFWDFISGDAELYITIIEPLGHQAREKNEIFEQGYA
jgi:Type II restriction endonuclease EcoO109I